MLKKNFLLTSAFIFILNLLPADNSDTIRLYRNKCGMLYKKYIWQLYWFAPKSPRNSYGFNPWTKQDNYFEDQLDSGATYIIFYDRMRRLEWEGPLQNRSIMGTVKYYYNNGKIKWTEQFGFEGATYWESEYNWSDAPYERGTWQYYTRRGRMYKEKIYVTLKSLDGKDYYHYCNTSFFNKKEKVSGSKSVLIESRVCSKR